MTWIKRDKKILDGFKINNLVEKFQNGGVFYRGIAKVEFSAILKLFNKIVDFKAIQNFFVAFYPCQISSPNVA